MPISDYFRNFWQGVQEEQTVLKFYQRIPDQQILMPGYTPQVMQPQESYFEIRLAEMFLANQRQYTNRFIPLGIILTDFLYNRQRESVPFLVGNQILKGLEKYVAGQFVEYYNTRIAGPVPYIGDDVGLFVGLFRSKVEDLSERLFSFLETVVGAFDLGQLTPYLKIAQQVRTGLDSILGASGQKVQYRLGYRDVFVDPEQKPNDLKKFRSGYLAYINCPENALDPASLRVDEDRLKIQKAGALQPLRSYDFCLVHLDSMDKRNDYKTFPFYKYWLDAVTRLHEGSIPSAEGKLMEFTVQLSVSPDLTEKHRQHMIALFQANFDQQIERIRGRKGGKIERDSTRSAEITGDMTAADSLQNIAMLAEKVKGAKEKKAVQALWDVHQNWSRIPYLQDLPKDFDWRHGKDEDINRLINDQLQVVGQVSKVTEPNPQGLADALMAAYLSPS
jgi:hypothetical protein